MSHLEQSTGDIHCTCALRTFMRGEIYWYMYVYTEAFNHADWCPAVFYMFFLHNIGIDCAMYIHSGVFE